MRRCRIIFAALSLLCASCSRDGETGAPLIPYVEEAMSDTASYASRVMRMAMEPYGAIAVVGPSEETMLVAEEFLTADRRDNISGVCVPDGLPDFCGETVQPVLDIANSPYYEYIALGNDAFLRELNVRNAVMCMDTVALQSPYDTANAVRKLPAKAVILSSTISSAYGCPDADTLLSMLGSSVRVFSPIESMASYASRRHGGRLDVIVWTTKANVEAGAYSVLDSVLTAEHACHVFAPDADSTRDFGSLQGRFLSLLDAYMDAGCRDKLSVMLLDDMEVDPSELAAVVEEVKGTDDDALLAYKNLLSPDFECIWPSMAMAQECLEWMRSENLFTHRVSMPEMRGYLTAPSTSLAEEMYDADGGLSYAFRYSRTAGSHDDTYSIVEFHGKYINDNIVSSMKRLSPKLYSLYVR